MGVGRTHAGSGVAKGVARVAAGDRRPLRRRQRAVGAVAVLVQEAVGDEGHGRKAAASGRFSDPLDRTEPPGKDTY